MTINDSELARLQVNVPVYSTDRPELNIKVRVEDGELVITVRRRDGHAITDDGPDLHLQQDGKPYYSFVGVRV